VRYDAEQDVYFVSNFNGSGSARDNNGFVSRMSPDGEIQQLRFVAGGAGGATLHAPRGMAITGDTLWVADVDGVAGFHRRTGAPVGTVTFPGETLGFLNDVAAGPDGTLYVTDTGTNRVYRIDGRTPRVLVSDSTLGGPNGITWDAAGGRLLVVPYGGGGAVRAVDPTTGTMTTALTLGAAKMDGVEVLPGGRMLIATQSDSSLHLVQGGTGRRLLRTAGQPADIGVDTRRNRVAVPYIALNRVDVWALPGRR
jgi:DNA-binding beta-propeller fold protein YncE